MFKNFPKFTKQNKTSSENSVAELPPTESDTLDEIPEKYLNINVRAMISGGTQQEPEKKYIFYLDKLVPFFKRTYQVEIKISREDT